MDIELLRTFLEVNRTRHFARAANNLFVTSAAVSARIKQLEKHFGVQLFLRKRGSIQPTNEGEKLIPLAETIVNTWFRTNQEVRLKTDLEARIHIGATSGLWLLSMQQKLQLVTEQLPEIGIQAEGHGNEDLTRLLLNGTMDLVIQYDPPTNPDVYSEKVGELSLVMAATAANTPLEDALASGYIYIDWGTSFANFHARKFGELPPAHLSVNLASIAISLLQQTGGSAFLPISTVRTNDWLYCVEAAPGLKRPIYASYQLSNTRLEVIRRAVDLIQGIAV